MTRPSLSPWRRRFGAPWLALFALAAACGGKALDAGSREGGRPDAGRD